MELAKINYYSGITKSNYLRHLVFGLLIPIALVMTSGTRLLNIPIILLFVINTVLYPFSRHCYERVIDFIMGENIMIVNSLIAIPLKGLTMFLCWLLAIIIAPIGLLLSYLQARAIND